MENETLAVTARIARKNGAKLPRGIHRRGYSLVVSFALADGTIERRSLGPVSAAYAEEQLGIFKRQVREGSYQKKQPRAVEVAPVTCLHAWEKYLADATMNGKRVDRMRQAWAHLETFAQIPASDLRPVMLQDYVTRRLAEGATNATVNRELACLRAALRFALRLEIISSVATFPRHLKEARPKQGFVSRKQYDLLAANCKELWLRTFLAIGFTYGWRKSEILGLRVRHVDLLEDWLYLETSKNGEGRRAPVTTELKALLARCIAGKAPDDFVLTHADGSPVVQPRKNWYSLCAQVGLGKFEQGQYSGLTMHDLRRSAARRLVSLGIPERTVMEITGHKTRSMFDRYHIQSEQNLRNAAARLESAEETAVKTDTKTDTSGFAHA
jgi:integrase